MNNNLNQLIAKRNLKAKEYNDTPSYSWKKKLYKLELDILNGKIKILRLRKQYQ